ncbi:MAG TPA: GFA family protein [Burkholderiales bacterium]
MTSEDTYTGGCLCGRIRYRAHGTPSNQSHCHCSLCRRSSGAAFVSWATFPAAGFSFNSGNPARYDSSDIAFRRFCPDCGTQLTFQFHKSPETIDVTLGSLDHPESVVPVDHIWTQRRIPWIKLDDGLPQFEQSRDDRDA